MPALLQVRREPVSRPSVGRFLIYGASGVGKTTFGADFHSAEGESLSIYAAPAGNHQGTRDRAHLVAGSLDELRAIMAGADVSGFDSVAVDDIQSILQWLIRAAEAKNQGRDFDELKFGRGWGWVRLELLTMLDGLTRRARNVVVISKEKVVEKLKDEGRVVEGIRPDIAPNVWSPLQGDFDYVGWAHYGPPAPGGAKHLLTFRGTPTVTAKSRSSIQWPATMPLEGRAVYDLFLNAPFEARKPQ